jgi:hydrogenase nickel incorporation protein HypA/HybF
MQAVMHELSLALALVDLACDQVARLEPSGTRAVHVRVGTLAGVDEQALRTSFDAATQGTPIAGAVLRIEMVAAAAWCAACAEERRLDHLARRRCPGCGGLMPELVRGTEFELAALEIEE